MLSFEIKKELELLLESYEQAHVFREGLNQIAENFPELMIYLSKVGGTSATSSTAAAQDFRKYCGSLRGKFGSLSPRLFFSSIETFRTQLDNITFDRVGEVNNGNEILSKISSFARTYDDYIQFYDPTEASALVFEAKNLSDYLDGFFSVVRDLHASLDGKPLEQSTDSLLTLYLSDSMSLEQFANRLLAIHMLYERLAGLMRVDLTEAPLRLQKVESGSLWSEVRGHPKVIGFIVDAIKSTASFVYKKFTIQGRIEAIPTKLETLNEVMDFTNRLQAEGVSVEEIHENLRLAAVGIAKDLNTILNGQSKVTLNGETVSVGEEVQKSLELSDSLKTLEYAEGATSKENSDGTDESKQEGA